MGNLSKSVLIPLILGCAAFIFAKPALAADWPPIPPEDLALKDNPAEPGAAAMILYRESVVHNKDPHDFYEEQYFRIKIFTEKGKEFATVQIPFANRFFDVRNVSGRTVHPDGKIVEFDGQVFDKLILKSGDVRIQYKVFSLPDVTPGSIIDFKYKNQIPAYFFGASWQIQGALYTRRAHFEFVPYGGTIQAALVWRAFGLTDVQPKRQSDGSWALDINNVPGVPEEDYAMPVNELRGHVEFFYTQEKHPADSKLYWDQVAKTWAENEDKFNGKRGDIQAVALAAVGNADSPEEKIKRLYARSQQIHNLSADPQKTSQEENRDKTKDSKNVADTLKHGYGYEEDINRFLVALVQAAGFESNLVWITPRNRAMFHAEMQNSRDLSETLVWVHAGDKEYFLDPGISHCPFGLLPWYATSIPAMKPTKNGAIFLQTPLPSSSASVIERHAQLSLAPDGSLAGTFTVRFTGERALTSRIEALNQDDIGRKKLISDEIKSWLPSTAKFDLTSAAGWDDADAPLEVQGTLSLPDMAESATQRLLVPLGLYEASQRQLFTSDKRNQDVYFHYPYEESDDITVQLPPGWHIEKLPPPQTADPGGKLKFEISAKIEGESVHIQRRLTVGNIVFEVPYYPELRQFFSTAKGYDEQQIILQTAASSGRN